MGAFVRKGWDVYWTDFTIAGRHTRVLIGRVIEGYAEKFAAELRAKMLLGYSLPSRTNRLEMALSELIEKSLQVSASNNAPRTVQREELAFGRSLIRQVSRKSPKSLPFAWRPTRQND